MNTAIEKRTAKIAPWSGRILSVLLLGMVVLLLFLLLAVVFALVLIQAAPGSKSMLKTITLFLTGPPSHIWPISAAFGVLALAALVARIGYPQVRRLPMLISSFLMFIACYMWLAFGIHQSNPDLQSYNIRIDLVFIMPLLLGGTALLTIGSIWSLVRAVRDHKK